MKILLIFFYTKRLNWNIKFIQALVKEDIVHFLKSVAQKVFSNRLHALQTQKGIWARGVEVSGDIDFISSCTKDGLIQLGVKLLYLSDDVIDMIILYEAARIKYCKNNKSFWMHLSILLGHEVNVDTWNMLVGSELDKYISIFKFMQGKQLEEVYERDFNGVYLCNPKNLLVLNNDYFSLKINEVDADTLLSKFRHCTSKERMYCEDGVCYAIVEYDGDALHLFYLENTNWNNQLLQSWLKNVVRKSIYDIANKVLPDRVHYLEAQHGINTNSIGVRFGYDGVCFRSKNKIVLSPTVMFMPEQEMNLVILHQLAHLKYPRHTKLFWKYLSSMFGKEVDTEIWHTFGYSRYISVILPPLKNVLSD